MTTPPKFLVCPNPTKGCTVPAPIWPTDPAMDLEIGNQVIFYQIMLIVPNQGGRGNWAVYFINPKGFNKQCFLFGL